MQFLLEGRIIPERVDFNLPHVHAEIATADGKKLTCDISIIKSKIFIHVNSDGDIHSPDIRNMMFTTIGDIVNYAGFQTVLGISYELDLITDIEKKSTYVFGVEGFVFDNTGEFGDRLTFSHAQLPGQIPINPKLLTDKSFSRATFELRNSIRYPDFTALHCRLAIEAIRNAFNADDESEGWKDLRENLKIKRETIESFKQVAADQRHGKNTFQSWAQRRHCMQIGWEIVFRYTMYRDNDPPSPLRIPEL